ncbi:FGGY carbohydrate kinase domain-containing protein-like isoform X1 [Eriocheir sinensis]|uniref:FGGY carbohydrate kinase domain-containing protein-like isoform X1 n=1 Tax=Eriocheir sinensis TaxID=95602 RepID=UPI0021C85D9B|nr:FGGY carbohydrate kinase domain-containing protein-like isoform X1 [Eriocheir sinensis]XP_050705762.1 FGGY carbohydrate kinase domain-containing protein-like isoform X1 [Eriocheir sinensis]XP_050705763.1 FGGY carbohydrate kinase domain-containing protein-like isoform X1 [Eriocheir sinensis]XP_050705764.1 FGGY carbohydrate kinase domain-containing protein-like isoform X1 [Eriocheir sinensis]XP_050705765.1 FGGY carbohydrate kinase domain-containing protein-like isoform X1 [Eriocheir sinensis]
MSDPTSTQTDPDNDPNIDPTGGPYYIGVDVGTGSVRAGLVGHTGAVERTHTQPIAVMNPQKDFYVQDSEEIWQAVGLCVKVVSEGVPDKGAIKGIGFDATCSLVVLDSNFKPVCVSPTGDDRHNVIMWMDHRAKSEAEEINTGSHRVLEYVGGRLSPEMQTPKLLWLKRSMEDTWKRAAHFFDLPDYLTFRATGSLRRSLCSLVCKWTYVGQGGRAEVEGPVLRGPEGWDRTFFEAIGLEELAEEGWRRIGTEVCAPGDRCGTLTHTAAHTLGLDAHTPVAASLIDAHAGFLAMAGAAAGGGRLTGRLGLINGTSTCHLVLSPSPVAVGGVWGPYGGAVLPQTYLAEGGITASGSLIDHLLKTHPAYEKSLADADDDGRSIYERLEGVLEVMGGREGLSSPSLLTRHLHLYPDYHGNRSPLADPDMAGMVCGVTLDASEESLAMIYLSAIQGLAYTTRQILAAMTSSGHVITRLLMCGGLCASNTYIQTHADVLGLEVLIPQQQPSVLLGAAMLGGAASGGWESLEGAARAMGGSATSYKPNGGLKGYHNKKFAVFLKMQQNQLAYRNLMK